MVDLSTGEIFPSIEEVKKAVEENPDRAKNIVQIDPELRRKLLIMNRKARRKYLKKHRKEFAGVNYSDFVSNLK